MLKRRDLSAFDDARLRPRTRYVTGVRAMLLMLIDAFVVYHWLTLGGLLGGRAG